MSKIALKNVSVSFGAQDVLTNISLEIQSGESVVLIGPSGQGKTTLLKTLSGLITPRNGEVFFEQRGFSTLSIKERGALLQKMGVLFQKNALFDSLTCFENIAFPLREIRKYSEAEIQKKSMHFLEAVGLSHVASLSPDEISGGMQKRLGIARALALNPEIVFYDDPTAGLDPITAKKIVELLIQLQKERKSTMISVTNDMSRAYQLADRIVMILQGQLIETGTPQQTRNHPDPRVWHFVRGLADVPPVS